MFIELHDAETSKRLLVNANDISTIIELDPDAEKTMLVFSGDLDTWRYVRESYEEIKTMLTGLLISKASQEEDLESLWNRMVYGSAGLCKREDK